MSFPKAKVVRFNEGMGCAPGVGHYDPKTNARIPTAVFEKTERFKEPISCKKSHQYKDQSSSLSNASSTSSLRSAKKTIMGSHIKESCSLEIAQNSGMDKQDNTSAQTESDSQILRENIETQAQFIKKLQRENFLLKSKLRNMQNNVCTSNRRESFNSPVCCSSPLLKYMGLSPIPSPSMTANKDNFKLREANYQKMITDLQNELRETETKYISLKKKFKDKPVAIIVNGSPERKREPISSKELSPENRKFVEAKHSALLKLSQAEDEIYKLKEELKNFEVTKQELALLEKEHDGQTKEIEYLKTQFLKSDIELKESRSFYVTLQETFNEKVKSQVEEIHQLTQVVLGLKDQIEMQEKQISTQNERETELTSKLVALKTETNQLKLEYEDNVHKGNEEIELLTAERENLRLILQEKVELEEEFKSQLQKLQSNDHTILADLKKTLQEQIQQLVSELESSSVKYKFLEDVVKEKEEEVTKLFCKVQDLEVELEKSKELLEKQQQVSNRENIEWKSKLKQSVQQILDITQSEKQKYDSVNELLTAELQHRAIYEEKNTQLDAQLQKCLEEIKELKDNELSMTEKISDLQKILSNFETTNIDLKKEKTALENRLLEQETFEIVLNKEIELLKSNQNQLKLESQVLKEQLETQLEEAAKNLDEKEQKENELWNRLREHKQQIKDLNQELAALREIPNESERWRELYEELLQKVEPFKDQLDMYAHERSLLVRETDQAWKELERLQQKTAKTMGHQNHKQKIQYVMKLNEDLTALRKENAQLKDENYKHFLALQKYQKTKGKSSQPLKEKENTRTAYF